MHQEKGASLMNLTYRWLLWEETLTYERARHSTPITLRHLSTVFESRGGKPFHGRIALQRDGLCVHIPLAGFKSRSLHNCAAQMSLSGAMHRAAHEVASGWWTLEQLRSFVSAPYDSVIFEMSMWAFGFKRSSRNREKWLRRQPNDLRPAFTQPPSLALSWEEFENKYRPQLIRANARIKVNHSFYLEAATGDCAGMLYVHLYANPLRSSSVGTPLEVLRSRFHLRSDQPDFALTVQNLLVAPESPDKRPSYYVIVTATTGSGEVTEVWPHSLEDEEAVIDLLNGFVERLKLAPVAR